jgi:hypothetical protein
MTGGRDPPRGLVSPMTMADSRTSSLGPVPDVAAQLEVPPQEMKKPRAGSHHKL